MVRDEAVSVCLHDGNCITLRCLVGWMRIPVTLFIIEVGKEDACSTLARHITEINIEGESAAKICVVEEGPFDTVIPLFICDESAVILANLEASVVCLELLAVQTLHVELIPFAISRTFPFLNVSDEWKPFCRLWLTITVAIAITVFSLFILSERVNFEAVKRPFGVRAT